MTSDGYVRLRGDTLFMELENGIEMVLLHNRRNQPLQRLARRASCSPSSAMSCLESHSVTQDPSIMQQSPLKWSVEAKSQRMRLKSA
ncbi:hypothetical protein JMK10_03090 [Rhodovulum sulfidophilum]|uniref:hypothetical protein n=1 Tax=Rhodovulum sulfidophilum TaxID=35806 RepID=UPI001922A570|nr:hypothetical protein [Rhodovulum sulfidophilum]MBL3575997.1 hypothetical protein [Rhodovulum sulfidophilum]MCE8431882.1 hypothetical protein [Rhodovulum sulfidophilum]MCF4115819.1 hypothetical protein [Rhodovulum sulfidophilum]